VSCRFITAGPGLAHWAGARVQEFNKGWGQGRHHCSVGRGAAAAGRVHVLANMHSDHELQDPAKDDVDQQRRASPLGSNVCGGPWRAAVGFLLDVDSAFGFKRGTKRQHGRALSVCKPKHHCDSIISTCLLCRTSEAQVSTGSGPPSPQSYYDCSQARVFGNVRTATFSAWNDKRQELLSQGVKLSGVGASVAQDLEPEYATFSQDEKLAFVALQVCTPSR